MGVTGPALAASNARMVVSAFRSRRAVSGASAKSLVELGLNLSQALRKLISERVIRRAGAHRYFLDEALWARRRQVSGRTLIRFAVPAALAALAAALYLSAR